MNQNSEEENIRRLFREARQADENGAPGFAATVERALSRKREPGTRRIIFRPAVVTISLVLLAGIAFVLLLRSTNGPSAPVATGPYPSSAAPPAVVASAIPLVMTPRVRVILRSRARRPAPKRTATLISQWTSPTDFLLRTPGDQLLKTLPRLGDSTIEIRMNNLDGKN